MRLKQINVYTFTSGREYQGSIEFEGPRGEIKLTLDKSLSQKVIRACAEEIVAASKHAAEAMTADVLNAALNPALTDETA